MCIRDSDTAGMVAGMVASGMTAKGLNGIEAEANKLAKAPKGIDGVTAVSYTHLNTLKEKVNEKYGVLSGLVNAWDDLCTKIQNFFN